MKKFKNIKNQKGQSVFEFIIFIPFLFVFFGVFIAILSSINGSINQLKVTRGYFYGRLQNNSTHPKSTVLPAYWGAGLTQAGLVAWGWQESQLNEQPVANCYRIQSFFGELPEDEQCEKPVKETGETGLLISTFVKVKTLYGLCGATYRKGENDGSERIYNGAILNSQSGCELN